MDQVFVHPAVHVIVGNDLKMIIVDAARHDERLTVAGDSARGGNVPLQVGIAQHEYHALRQRRPGKAVGSVGEEGRVVVAQGPQVREGLVEGLLGLPAWVRGEVVHEDVGVEHHARQDVTQDQAQRYDLVRVSGWSPPAVPESAHVHEVRPRRMVLREAEPRQPGGHGGVIPLPPTYSIHFLTALLASEDHT